MKNENNNLNLKQRSSLLIVRLKEGITVAIPVIKKLSNAMVVKSFDDGAFTAHWNGNFNIHGDFRSELMTFDNNLVLDEKDFDERNEFRIANGLVPMK